MFGITSESCHMLTPSHENISTPSGICIILDSDVLAKNIYFARPVNPVTTIRSLHENDLVFCGIFTTPDIDVVLKSIILA